jgi:hypothetical protein
MLFREAVLSKQLQGNLGPIHKSLATINYRRDGQNHLVLSIAGQLPAALRRNGRQDVLTAAQMTDISILPGDTLRVSDWELSFKESASGVNQP